MGKTDLDELDALLDNVGDEVAETTKTTETTETTKKVEVEAEDDMVEVDDILNEIQDSLETTSEDDLPKDLGFALENDANDELLTELLNKDLDEVNAPQTPSDDVAQEILDDLTEDEAPEEVVEEAPEEVVEVVEPITDELEIEAIKEPEPEVSREDLTEKIQEKFADSITDKLTYSEEFKDAIPATKEFMYAVLEKEAEMLAIREEIKDLKAEAKTNGVRIADANKAIKETIAELKETTETSVNIASMKQLIKETPALYDNLVARATVT